MNFKKKVNGSWADIPHYIHKTSTDTITTLPAVLYPNDTTATVGLKGNMQQTGTPTPVNPIMPEGTGDKTANLFDGSIEQGTLNENAAIGTSYNGTKSIPAAAINSYRVRVTNPIYIDRELTFSIDFNSYQMYVLFFDENQKYTGSHSSSWRNSPLTLSGEYIGKHIGLVVKSKQSGNVPISPTDDIKLMLNTGSTALPYEPYGYKLDISCSGENLFNISTAVLGKWINSAGEEKTSSVSTQEYQLNHTDYITIMPNTEYVFSYDGDYSVASIAAMCWFDSNKNIISKIDYPINGQKKYSFSATAPGNARYCIVNFSGYNGVGKSDMIFIASSVVQCYLGEEPSTRRIKKLVLTGEENFVYDSNYTRFRFVIPNSLILGVRRTPVICTHYEPLTDGRPIGDVSKNTIYSDSVNQKRWWIEAEDFTSADDFKAYLAAQYAAGTPVMIWYILTEPEIAIVNEPLMKIGDYADEIINISVPTIVGTNTFDIGTTVQPSEVTANYHGWHPVSEVHEESRE